MLLAGDDYEPQELGFLKKALGKVAGGVKTVASYTPPGLVIRGVVAAAPTAAKVGGAVAKIGGTAAGALVGQAVKTIAGGGGAPPPPPCGFFQRVSKFFGGSPSCQ